MPPPSKIASGASRRGRSNSSAAGKKRSSSQIGAPLPPTKRSCSTSPTEAGNDALSNRVHRRVVLRDYGKPIYKASSRSALLAAFEGSIEGHESLRKAGFLHRDISINNLMINEDDGNHSWPSFLIDLDLAIKVQREAALGARGKTGTRAFMAIGALLGEQHSFMHDFESFFWVLFWICIHYKGPDEGRAVPRFEEWNYVDTEELAELKKGQVSHEGDFIRTAEENFTPYYQPLIPWVNRLRKAVFPNGGRWEKDETELGSTGMLPDIYYGVVLGGERVPDGECPQRGQWCDLSSGSKSHLCSSCCRDRDGAIRYFHFVDSDSEADDESSIPSKSESGFESISEQVNAVTET
ncbi:hypothetical protein GGTG_13856 [Gaeumannomyces tritici R3-111a-1]|uniref:non-specific serine/threonine protein kinase n=1 Tax=Gaeumannomyces tritici (strain R3-111a-1) TaxID=644352 RepID=J3PK11_GAET3|nr:hypothetical protein GGTG_13856 [Gaeumannomyces tritici R3-111a-1]EJT68570.1 hypothetical protein GGTG_13856 [Gaeumannomyces tritici R3-111a-1]